MARYFTKQEIDEAKNVNLVELLYSLGINIKQEKKGYIHPIHDSLKISEYKGWNWFSRELKGNPIDYLMMGPDFSLEFYEAVALIRNQMSLDKNNNLNTKKENTNFRQHLPEVKINEKAEFVLPEKNADNKRVCAYLNKSRNIDYQFINHCIKNGLLYESKTYHNAVFVGKDFESKPKFASQRGTNTKQKFAGDVAGSDKKYNFRIDGKSNVIRVFESAIDALSYLTIFKLMGIKCEDTLLSLSGVSTLALDTYLTESNKQVDIIVVCTDNDVAGIKCFNEINEKYKDQYKVINNIPKTEGLDYNEYLSIMIKERGIQR